MSERVSTRRTGADLLRELSGRDCPSPGCDGGLERGQYKGTTSVLCPDCETPVLRLWGRSR